MTNRTTALGLYRPNRHLPMEKIIADFEKRVEIIDRHLNTGTRFDKDWLIRMIVDAPGWVESFFPSVRPEMLAPIYNDAFRKVLGFLRDSRGGQLVNNRDGSLGPEFLRQLERSAVLRKDLYRLQKKSEVYVIPTQFGNRYNGVSVERVRRKVQEREFCLGAFDVCLMLLAEPCRLNHPDQLYVDCAGDEIAPEDSPENFTYAPTFRFNRDMCVVLDAGSVGHGVEGYGTASGFISD